MWAKIEKEYIKILCNDEEIILNLKNGRDVKFYNGNLYVLTDQNLFKLNKNKEVFKSATMSHDCSAMAISEKEIFVIGTDTGTLYSFSHLGEAKKWIHLGEHIADVAILGNNVVCATFHENKLLLINEMKILEWTQLEYTPQRIRCAESIYILSHDGFFSVITMFNAELNKIAEIKFERQIGDIFLFGERIVFNGVNYNYVLDCNLKAISAKKSTGELLCRFSDEPLTESGKKFDWYNNLIY